MDRKWVFTVLESLQLAFLKTSFRKKQRGSGSSQGAGGFPPSTPVLCELPHCCGPNKTGWKWPTAFAKNNGIILLKKIIAKVKLALHSSLQKKIYFSLQEEER